MVKHQFISAEELKKIYYGQRQGDGSMMIKIDHTVQPSSGHADLLPGDGFLFMGNEEYTQYLLHNKIVTKSCFKDEDEEFHEKVIEVLEKESKKEKKTYSVPVATAITEIPWPWFNLAEIFGKNVQVKAIRDKYKVTVNNRRSFFVHEDSFEGYLVLYSQEYEMEELKSILYNVGLRTRDHYDEETGKLIKNTLVLDPPVESF